MTACAIISAAREQSPFLLQNFSGCIHDVLDGADRVYLLSRVNRRDADQRYVDPIDGLLLVECKYFDSEAAARQWVAADIASRCFGSRGVQ